MPARGPRAQLLWPSGRASATCARVFFVAPLFRAAATFFVVAPWFSTSGNQESAAAVPSLRLIRSLSIFAVETLLALRGAELPTCGRCNSA